MAMRRLIVIGGLMLLALSTMQCSEDAGRNGAGDVDLTWRVDERAPFPGLLDSLHLLVEGPELRIRERRPLLVDDDLEFDLRLEETDDLSVALWIDSQGERARGLTALGEVDGVEVRAARTSRVEVALTNTVPALHPITAMPGDLDYEVSWTPIPGALGYEVLEEIGEESQTYSSADTSFTFQLRGGRERSFAAGGEPLIYRVRAELVRGWSRHSEPRAFLAEDVRDLPFIVSTEPPDEASAVGDTVQPRIEFDRNMNWPTLSDETVRLLELPLEDPVAIDRRGDATLLTLEPEAPLRRGRRYRVEIDPGVEDVLGRPFDQDAEEPGLQGYAFEFAVQDYDPLLVLSVDPESGEASVPIGSEVQIRFNREIDESTVTNESVVLETETGSDVAVTRSFDAQTATLTLVPTVPLGYETNYAVEVTTDVLDLFGEPLDQDPLTEIPIFEPFTSSFRTEDQPAGARIVDAVPAPDERNHPTFDNVVVTFDREMNPSTVVSQTTFRVRKLPVGASINGVITVQPGNRVFTFVPASRFEQGTEYELELTTGILDAEGIPLDQDPDTPGFQRWFSKFRAEENLQVVGVTPRNNEGRVEPTAEIAIEFNLAADPTSVTEGSAQLLAGGEPISVLRLLSGNGRTLTLDPVEDLDVFTEYTVRLNEGVRTVEGSVLDQNLNLIGRQAFQSIFTTRPDSIPPQVASVEPAPDATGVDPESIVQVRFTKEVLPSSVNVETFLVRPLGGDPLIGRLDVDPDRQGATFTPVEAFTLLRTYEVEITTWVVDDFDVRLDQDPDLPKRQGWKSTFTIDHERVSPSVVAVSPADGEEDVSAATSIEVLFDEAMNPASIPGAITLRDEMALPVDGMVVVAADSARATFTPNAVLEQDRVFLLQVATTATDRWGNPLDQNRSTSELEPFQSSFRTERDRVGPAVVSVSPEDGAVDVEPEVQPTVVLDEAVADASLGGVRLFRGDDVEVALSGRTRTSPAEVRLEPAEPLLTSTLYRVVVDSVLTDTLGNPFDQIPDTDELDSYVSQFTVRDENVPPTVLNTVFEDEPVPQDTQPRIVFSEAIDPGSLEAGDLRLFEIGGEEVSVSTSWVAPETLLVNPDVLLLPSTDYRMELDGVTDLFGNVFDQIPETGEVDSYVREFVTADDTMPPMVVSVFPENGAEGVVPEVVISLGFNEPMMTSTFNDLHFSVSRVEGSLEYPGDGEITWDDEARTFFFTPTSPLQPGFEYRVRADFFLQDLAGNPLDQDPDTPDNESFESSFLVGDFPDVELGPSVCADTTWVTFDASGTVDPDGVIETLWFQWGDGTETFIENPEPADYVQSHGYPCLDFAGCDGIDNDGDGLMDAEDCNESYRVILMARDDDTLWSADTSGVSFCALGVLGSEPANGASNVDTLLTEVVIDLTRAIPDSTLSTDYFRLRLGGLIPVDLSDIRFGESDSQVILELGQALTPDRFYTIDVLEGLVDTNGRPFDQDPCTPEIDRYRATFTTVEAPPRPQE